VVILTGERAVAQLYMRLGGTKSRAGRIWRR